MKVKLHIETPYETKTVDLDGEISIGRTDQADLVLDDTGLSRLNTTFFVDDGEIYVSDENSLNGTFLNGVRVARPQAVRDGDEIKIGSNTRIRVKMGDGLSEPRMIATGFPEPEAKTIPQPPIRDPQSGVPKSTAQIPQSQGPPIVLIAAGAMIAAIVLMGIVALIVVSLAEEDGPKKPGTSATPAIASGALIPVRVIDPLGAEDEDDLDDLIASWEVAEEEINAANVSDISSAAAGSEEAELNVTAAYLAERQKKAFEDRPGEKGIRPAGLNVPKELFGDGVIKQKAKLAAMNSGGYRQPMDFADLADKRLNRELIEMPMATQSFYLDVGGSAQDKPFSSFSFKESNQEILVGSPKFGILSRLAGNFAGQKYDLNNAGDRKQMRMRLLRMFQPNAKPILKELADAYFKQFGRPLRVTSLTRSMDYQILLNQGNANSFKVRGEGSLPPHTSGCAFDLARKHMPVEEQNFVMAKLAQMERDGKLDALIEYGANACFHVFIYHDSKPPRM